MKRAAVTMRAALGDPRLLGASLQGDSWANWRVFLIAAMGEKLNAKERAIFRRFTGRQKEPGARVEEALFLIGRRGGKDRSAAALATYLAALVDWSGVLARGERGLVLCVGADTSQATVQRNYIEGVFDASPMLSSLVAGKTADGIELSNGVSIAVRAANFRRLRGVTCVAIIASEAAFWMSEEGSSNADVEILNALRPTLGTTGGPLILITTPWAARGEVFNIHRQHYGAAGDPRILVVQGTTADFNPTISPKVIARAMERDPAAAAAEYLAQFRTDLEAFVSREVVEAAVVAGRRELPPASAISYFAFVDPSGGSVDAMTLAIAHRDEGGRAVLDAVREVRPPFSPLGVVTDFAALLKSYGIAYVTGDKFAGQFASEPFANNAVRYAQSDTPKSDLYRDLLPLLNSGRVELLDNPRLVSQLCSLERRMARGGRDSIAPPPGGHDDLANAVAGALLLTSTAAPALWAREALKVEAAPIRAEVVIGVAVAGEREVGVAYLARDYARVLHVAAVESGPLSPALLDGIPTRLLSIEKATGARAGAWLFAQGALVAEFARRGHRAANVDSVLAEGCEALALSAAVHVARGAVRVADQRHGGILSGRSDAPERMAMLLGIALALDQGRTL